MGGRGTHSLGIEPEMQYHSIGTFQGSKVLEKINRSDSANLPLDAKSSRSYVQLDDKGQLRMYREYDDNHRLKFEIGYHSEKDINSSHKPVIHAHDIEYTKDVFKHGSARHLTSEELKKYEKLIKGLNI